MEADIKADIEAASGADSQRGRQVQRQAAYWQAQRQANVLAGKRTGRLA